MAPPRLTAIALVVLFSACAQPNASYDAFRGGPRDGGDAGGILHFDYDSPTSTTAWDFIGPARASADPAQIYGRADTAAAPPAPHRTKVDAQALAAYMNQSLGAAVVATPPSMATPAASETAATLTTAGAGVPVSTEAGTVLTSFPALNVANNPAPTEPTTVLAVTVPGHDQDPAVAGGIAAAPPVPIPLPVARPRTAALPTPSPEVADDRANVFSRIGSSTLSAPSVDALSKWVPRMMAALDDGKPVGVTGMTDPSGAIQTNERLAAERAGAVLNLLKLRGVDIGRLAVKLEPSPGVAKTAPSAEEAARLRRVQLTIGAAS